MKEMIFVLIMWHVDSGSMHELARYDDLDKCMTSANSFILARKGNGEAIIPKGVSLFDGFGDGYGFTDDVVRACIPVIK